MPKVSLFPTGGLDLDSDINKLEKGDYPSASNIIVSGSKDGGGGTIKIMESIKSLPLATMGGTYKASFRAPDGSIYYLYRTNGTTATIYKVASDLLTITNIVSYTHAVTVDFVPDLKIIGDNIVWNYYGTGQLLYWLTTRTPGATIPGADLFFNKRPPVNAISVTKVITLNSGQDLLEKNDFQFCARYKYDNGEYSVLGPWTEMYKGKKDTSSYTVSASAVGKPTYASFIEIYVRNGDFGTLRRIATFELTGASAINWKGDIYETLSDEESTATFSAVPFEVGTIEVAVDRIIVGNFQDDYTNDSAGAITITVGSGYALGGGAIKNYLNAGTDDASINSNETGTYYKPFANNSTYSVGVLLFDQAMKTRGVEFATTFQTGKFTYPIAPVFNLNTGGYTKPSYAKYMQLAITKNLSKSKIYEGFASNVYFELEYQEISSDGTKVEKKSKNKLSVLGTDVANVKYLVVDITGMYNAGELYSYQQGDRITISVPTTTNPTTDVDLEQTGEYRILDMPVVYADSQKVFCTWNGGECLNDAIPNSDKLYFEIYSVRQTQEDQNVLFYGVGDVIDVSGGIPGSVSNYKIGDTVFKKFGFYKYTKPVLTKGYSRSLPPVLDLATVTEVKSVGAISKTYTPTTASLLGNRRLSGEFFIPLNTAGTPFFDAGKFLDGSYIPKGFYENNVTKYVQLFLTVVPNIVISTPSYSVTTRVYCSLERTPFDASKGTYGSAIRIGEEVMFYGSDHVTDKKAVQTNTVFYDAGNPGFNFVSSGDVKENITSGDKINIKIRIQGLVERLGGVVPTLSLAISNSTSEPAKLVLTGNRTKPVVEYFAKDAIPLSITKTDYAVRAMSNIVNFGQWNTSAGNAFVRASSKVGTRRTNAFRHGGNIVYGTDVNNIGNFSVLNTYEVQIENGAILSLQRASRLQGAGDMLLALCENEVSYILLGEATSNQSSNYALASGVDSIIGSIRNIGERTGIQDRASLYNFNGTVFWWDNSRSLICKFDKSGVDIISAKKARSYFVKKNGVASFAFDPFYNLLFVKIGIDPAIGFDTDESKWKSFFALEFDSALHIGDRTLYTKLGVLYRSLESATGNVEGEYMGTTNDGTITLVANVGTPIYPTNVVIGHNMEVTNYANPNYIKSPLLEIAITNENGQETTITEGNFIIEDNKLFAHVLRDELSVGGIINGDFVRGTVNAFELKLKDNSQRNRIFEIEVEVDKVTGH